jgi:hypothetical protein
MHKSIAQLFDDDMGEFLRRPNVEVRMMRMNEKKEIINC